MYGDSQTSRTAATSGPSYKSNQSGGGSQSGGASNVPELMQVRVIEQFLYYYMVTY